MTLFGESGGFGGPMGKGEVLEEEVTIGAKLLIAGMLVGIPEQKVYMVWGPSCISKIEVTQRTKLEAPMKDDGTPDMKNARLINPLVTYEPKCGSYETRKENRQ